MQLKQVALVQLVKCFHNSNFGQRFLTQTWGCTSVPSSAELTSLKAVRNACKLQILHCVQAKSQRRNNQIRSMAGCTFLLKSKVKKDLLIYILYMKTLLYFSNVKRKKQFTLKETIQLETLNNSLFQCSGWSWPVLLDPFSIGSIRANFFLKIPCLSTLLWIQYLCFSHWTECIKFPKVY